MALLGTLLRNRRAGESRLAWNAPNLAGAETLTLSSPDFVRGGALPAVHAAKRAGGRDLSPALAWSAVPERTAQLLLVIEDPDAPMSTPFVHCVAVLEPSVDGLAQGALGAGATVPGVRVLRSGQGRGYLGPAPIRGHGPHSYVFQLFAPGRPLVTAAGGAALESARPRDVLAAAADVTGRGRLDGTYERA
jgi:phosphatidylethanolamine-binding protein (PEBP) family uncharacterized protein